VIRPLKSLKKSWRDLDILVGGMGVDISSVQLVAAAANHPSGCCSGSLSATGLAEIYTRLLQLGDPGDEVRKAFDAFCEAVPALAEEVRALFASFHIPGGKDPEARFRGVSMKGMTPPREVQVFTIASTFAHVWRAKQAAPGRPIGINFLRKIERVLLYGLYGAMVAKADWIVMGAGDPRHIPGFLDQLSRHEPVTLPVDVATVPQKTHNIVFDPIDLVGTEQEPPHRPAFLAIVSAHEQAQALASNPATRPSGFVVEGPAAGGHNAPPRQKKKDSRGYYEYGPEDIADLKAVAAIGLPFWAAGGRGYPRSAGEPRYKRQVGTLFALCRESGMDPEIRKKALKMIWSQELDVVTDAVASPSTYPFKVAKVPGTMGDPAVYSERRRVCDVGHLRGWRPREGKVVGLCPAMEPAGFKQSGGASWRTQGCMCLCNGLLATCGLGQPKEPGLVTLGDIEPVRTLLKRLHRMDYSAAEAIDFLLEEPASA